MSQTSITKRADLTEKGIAILAEHGMAGYNVGDVFIDREGNVFKILEIEIEKLKKHNDHRYTESGIYYVENKNWDCTEWGRRQYRSLNECGNYNKEWVKVEEDKLAAYRKQSLDIIEGKLDINSFNDKESDNINSNNAVMGKASKHALQVITGELEKKKTTALIAARFVQLEMAKRKAELDAIKDRMYGVIAEFEKKIKKIMRVITTIELYLGIEEEIFCIQEGEKAPANTPITFRQQVLYMDEEIGHWEDGGLDFTNIDWFDKWLSENDNYKSCFPEEKGIVVFRPRRKDKEYKGYDEKLKEEYNFWNRATYMLIRNGECLHRVYTDRIRIAPTLFPLRNELQELMKQMQDIMSKGDDLWSADERKLNELEDVQYQYKKRAVLMQGLIDRTELLHPLPAEKINIFNLDELGDKVQFIYDAEATLGQGKLTFNDWHKKLNESIEHGSRVLLTGNYPFSYGDKGYFVGKRIFFYTNEDNTPPPPNKGIYDIDEYKEETREWLDEEDFEKAQKKHEILEIIETRQDRLGRPRASHDAKSRHEYVKGTDDYILERRVRYIKKHLTILHNPADKVTGGWGNYDPHERKKRIRFKLFRDDGFVLNYDKLSMEDIDFYLTSRTDRPNYLHMMPVLQSVKKFMIEEQAKEQDFKLLIFQQVHGKLPTLTEEQVKDRITRCLEWWKYKNQLKRAITKDDTLALRMIIKRVTSANYAKLKWEE